MMCIAPDEITGEQLLAFVDGEADGATVDHIRHCPHCAARVRAYADIQQFLRAIFYRVNCPEAHTLGEYHLGLLSSIEQAAIEDHLKNCFLCAADLARVERFLEE
jgi:anti-sigma factor RsiW